MEEPRTGVFARGAVDRLTLELSTSLPFDCVVHRRLLHDGEQAVLQAFDEKVVLECDVTSQLP